MEKLRLRERKRVQGDTGGWEQGEAGEALCRDVKRALDKESGDPGSRWIKEPKQLLFPLWVLTSPTVRGKHDVTFCSSFGV